MTAQVCPYADLYQTIGEEYGIPWWIMAGQCRVESNFHPRAVGSLGEKGLAQFMDKTWGQYGDGDPFNPKDAITAQAKYLNWLKTVLEMRGKPQWKWVVTAYNWGIGRVLDAESWNDAPDHVKHYVNDVFEYGMVYEMRRRQAEITQVYWDSDGWIGGG